MCRFEVVGRESEKEKEERCVKRGFVEEGKELRMLE